MNYEINEDTPAGVATEVALRLLIRNSLLAREWARKGSYGDKSSVASYLRDIMTVKLCGGRRCGHTSMGVKVVKELFEKPAFMWANQEMAKMWAKEFGLDSSACGSYNSLNYLRGREFDCILMDDPSFAGPGKVEAAMGGVCRAMALKFPDRFTVIQVGF